MVESLTIWLTYNHYARGTTQARRVNKDLINMRNFECFICCGSFVSDGEPIAHYDKEDEDAVSLCDSCTKDVLSLLNKFNDKQPNSGDEVLINHQGKLIECIYDGCGMFYDSEGEKYFESDWVLR